MSDTPTDFAAMAANLKSENITLAARVSQLQDLHSQVSTNCAKWRKEAEALQERVKVLEAECAQAWEQFSRMRALYAEAKYGDRLKNQVLLTKDAALSQENKHG